jgi:hypothetical protein
MLLIKALRIASVASTVGIVSFGARLIFAVPPVQVPYQANYYNALYSCERQCDAHIPPTMNTQYGTQYCASSCYQMLHATPSVPVTPASGGNVNCTLTMIGDWGFYGACQAIWTVTTAGLGQVTNLVASLLGGNMQAAQGLVNAAKGAADPCNYLKTQLDAQYQAWCG